MRYINLLVLVLLVSCTKDGNTTSDTIFVNTTPHVIRVEAYHDGIADQNVSFELEPNETRNVDHNNIWGVNHGLCYGYSNMPMDSFFVTFDNTRSIAHYKPNLQGINPRSYLYESKRNIYNDASYQYTIIKSTETMRTVEFLYSFTEQDYADAQ